MKKIIKKIVPKRLWESARKNRLVIRDTILNFGKEKCSIAYCGFKLFYSKGTTLIEKIRGGKYFEEELCEAIVKDMPLESGVFLDIGANIGLISLYVLSRRQNTLIYAFEPGPHQYGYLKETIEYNEIGEQLFATNTALGEREETKKFVTHSGSDVSKDGFVNTGRGEGMKEIDVSVTTLDLWWRKAGKPRVSVVKIDTEGAELLILRGATEFLKEIKPVLYFEIEPRNLEVYPYKAIDVVSYVRSLGYTVSTLGGEVVREENLENFLQSEDTFVARQ
jgi:FkbM family methyltransferase